MTDDHLSDYFAALGRLQKGCPKIVLKGTKITNDAVALEAGRGKGSIKKSRDSFKNLIDAIAAASANQSSPKNEQTVRVKKIKQKLEDLEKRLDASYAREISLIAEIFELKKKLAQFQIQANLPDDNVVPIIKKRSDSGGTSSQQDQRSYPCPHGTSAQNGPRRTQRFRAGVTP